ncbi:oxidoreductase [Lactobacillus helveticus]|uniref:oxidoreductase n=1 Tax=Lactobacillus helveticus TaxID=1587 RepID=UPI0002DCF840|nr:oxidoreductase [Lactobacillus helveticus]NRN83942.1 Glyoxal reductase [Lactobacillus helveticus]NRO81161.1 Glyoxal reductase [Lactobacillus helveticus]
MALLDEAVVLNDGSLMPKTGIIVKKDDDVTKATKLGYRLLDCAVDDNLKIKDVNPQLYVEVRISKLAKGKELHDNLKSIRANLIADQADLCLLNLSDDNERNNQTWQKLEQLKITGWVKTLGIETDEADALEALLKNIKFKPNVLRLKCEDTDLLTIAKNNKLQVEIPVKGDIAALAEIADKYHTSPMELVLCYFNQKGIIPLVEASEMIENPQVNFNIKSADMATISQLFVKD